MNVSRLDKEIIDRRANANPAFAGIWVGFTSLFASVPISIQQKDWRIWAIPFGAALMLHLCALAYQTEQAKLRNLWKTGRGQGLLLS